jgi:hypothetical protein
MCKKNEKSSKNAISCFSFAQQSTEKEEVGLLCTMQALFNYDRYTYLVVAVVEIPFLVEGSLSLTAHH